MVLSVLYFALAPRAGLRRLVQAPMLRQQGRWGCIEDCGACCYLEKEESPTTMTTMTTTTTSVLLLSSKRTQQMNRMMPPPRREELDEWLTAEEMKTYDSMVGPDGWCVNFDKDKRLCKIYDTRPRFCRVEPKTFKAMYDVEPEEMDSFCTSCCREHICDVYGQKSREMTRFNQGIKKLRRDFATDEKRRVNAEAQKMVDEAFGPDDGAATPRP